MIVKTFYNSGFAENELGFQLRVQFQNIINAGDVFDSIDGFLEKVDAIESIGNS
jgi:hypothetical protein